MAKLIGVGSMVRLLGVRNMYEGRDGLGWAIFKYEEGRTRQAHGRGGEDDTLVGRLTRCWTRKSIEKQVTLEGEG